ncbi:MAG: hypothetical protein NTZ94_18530 [Verrucomicrobia bacterium]|nr:hypothetical protein [Verrucomicrobiota bacterium]
MRRTVWTLLMLVPPLPAQTLPREYVYLNGRVAAVEVSSPPCTSGMQVLSVLPAGGSTVVGVGQPQNIELNYCNPFGGAATGQATLLINEEFYASRGCYFVYNGIYDMYFLMNDNGDNWLTYSNNVPLTNSYCTISNPSRVISGNYLTVKATITFSGALAGSTNLWSAITNNTYTATSNWTSMGSWNVGGNLPPSGATYSASGTRSDMTIPFSVTDSNGYRNLYHSIFSITNSPGVTVTNACVIFYDQMSGSFFLANDAFTAWQAVPPGGNASNSQCALSSLSAASGSGNSLLINTRVSFPSAGTRYIYGLVYDRDLSYWGGGWQLLSPALVVNP